MRTTHFIGYYIPKSDKKANYNEIRLRNFILDFKRGECYATDIAAQVISREILENFDNVRTHLICVPAATQRDYEKRYCRFCELVCKYCGMVNDFNAVYYYGERLAIHSLPDRGESKRINAMTCCDIEVIAGEKYVIFDDIITHGKTFKTVADYIESRGGKVVAGYFLGKTLFRKH